ncbi:MAG: hypothetical protein JO288_11280 [Hyphomicrobiales bacterium]|nr:hypothetical protein [Hyphomicrobiales bacterium]
MNQLVGVVKETAVASPGPLLSDVGAFQLLAWFAIFRLLALSGPARVAQWRDFLVALALCCFVFIPARDAIWITALGIAVYCWLVSGDDPKLCAAGTVLAALSVQELWGRIVFKLFELPLLHAETAVVGTMLQAVRPATVWRDNIITGPNGHGIVVYDLCSSFHNLPLAALCWLTVRSLRDHSWQTRDFVTGAAVGMAMVVWNVMRLCLMAWDADLYRFWHDGAGTTIFDLGASISILLISLYGSAAGGRAT